VRVLRRTIGYFFDEELEARVDANSSWRVAPRPGCSQAGHACSGLSPEALHSLTLMVEHAAVGRPRVFGGRRRCFRTARESRSAPAPRAPPRPRAGERPLRSSCLLRYVLNVRGPSNAERAARRRACSPRCGEILVGVVWCCATLPVWHQAFRKRSALWSAGKAFRKPVPTHRRRWGN